MRRVVVNGLCHGLADGNGGRSVSTGFRHSFASQPTSSTRGFGEGEGCQRTLSPRPRTAGQADSRMNGWRSFSTLPSVATRVFGVGEGVCFDRLSTTRAAGWWWSTDSVTNSRTGTDGGRLRGGRGCPCGGVVVNGLCHGLADVNGWRLLRDGGGCLCGGVAVNGLCHPAQEQRGRRSRGWERMEVTSGRGRLSLRREVWRVGIGVGDLQV